MNRSIMKIKDEFIDLIENDIKKHEYRLADPIRLQLKIGDTIVLRSKDNVNKYVDVVIKNIKVYRTWEEALENKWEDDFKGLYSSKDEVLKECSKFYSRDEINDYGIVVYSIEKIVREYRKSKVLLDTNIFIQRESYNNVSIEVVNLYKWFDNLGMVKCIHPCTIDELAKFKDEKIKENMLLKAKSYQEINSLETRDTYFDTVIDNYEANENDKIDDELLLQVYNSNVDYLITNDKKIIEKSKKLFIDKYVYSPQTFLTILEKKYPKLVDYNVLSVELLPIGSLNIDDEFFDSLREDYNPVIFNNWLRGKSYEYAYVFKEKDKLDGFLYLKTEYADENYSDISPKFESRKRLKVGTFKISKTGLRLGERFLKIIFDNAIRRDVDEIYVTMFENRRDEVTMLQNLMMKWGFIKHGYKQSNIGTELVLIKDMRNYDYDKGPIYNYPLIKKNINNYGFLPIQHEYHTKLFPDLYIKNEDMSLYTDNACGYAIEKIYICNSKITNLVPGDLMFIYRMGDRDPKSYTSVVTGLAIFNEMIIPKSKEEYMQICKNRTVFSQEELSDFYDNKNYRTIVKVLYLRSFNKKIILRNLWDNNVIEYPNGPRISTTINSIKYQILCNLDKRNEP